MADFSFSKVGPAAVAMDEHDYIEKVLSGRLEPQVVLWGYARGIFPMADPETDRIEWFCPDPRGVLDLGRFHIPHGLRPVLRRGKFRVTINQAFERVIRGCGNRSSTWINDVILDCYCRLYEMGCAHSVEAWAGDDLAGGLYGVAIGGAFFGESMFHSVTDASKVALVGLVQQLREQDYSLLDIQFITGHLRRFGARQIPRSQYLHRLARALRKPCEFARPNQQTVEIKTAS